MIEMVHKYTHQETKRKLKQEDCYQKTHVFLQILENWQKTKDLWQKKFV